MRMYIYLCIIGNYIYIYHIYIYDICMVYIQQTTTFQGFCAGILAWGNHQAIHGKCRYHCHGSRHHRRTKVFIWKIEEHPKKYGK